MPMTSEATPTVLNVRSPATGGGRSLVLDDVHVSYTVQEQATGGLRQALLDRGRSRPSSHRVHAVRGVTMAVREGESVGLMGRNGSGKSSLLRAVAGLIAPERGSVYARSAPVLLGVSMVLKPQLSGRRNVMLGATALGLTRREVRRRFDEIVDFADLADVIDLPMASYSSGMRARLQFSIASSVRPDILLIDEALAVGDMEFQERSQARIAEILGAAGTVFLVSHNTRSLVQSCTRGIWLDQGEVVLDGPVQPVVAAYSKAMKEARIARLAAEVQPRPGGPSDADPSTEEQPGARSSQDQEM